MYAIVTKLICRERVKEAEEMEKSDNTEVIQDKMYGQEKMLKISEEKKETIEKKPPKKVKNKELIKQRKKERKENKSVDLPGKEGALQYLETWKNDRENWKFKKNKQVYLNGESNCRIGY